MSAGVPAEVLGDLLWSCGGGPWPSRQELSDAIGAYQREIRGDAGRWSPDERVLSVPHIDVVWEDFSSDGDPEVARIASADGGGLTALDLMWGIEQAFGARIAPLDHHFFEGLALRRETASEAIPCYDLQLGS
jgi:hypothetical protein